MLLLTNIFILICNWERLYIAIRKHVYIMINIDVYANFKNLNVQPYFICFSYKLIFITQFYYWTFDLYYCSLIFKLRNYFIIKKVMNFKCRRKRKHARIELLFIDSQITYRHSIHLKSFICMCLNYKSCNYVQIPQRDLASVSADAFIGLYKGQLRQNHSSEHSHG